MSTHSAPDWSVDLRWVYNNDATNHDYGLSKLLVIGGGDGSGYVSFSGSDVEKDNVVGVKE